MAQRLDCGFRGPQSWAEERGERAEVRQGQMAGGAKEDGGRRSHECVVPRNGRVCGACAGGG